ncbi:MAG: DsrE/DsrF/DrsH-like family protein [Defluviicoccus sp.]
MVEAVQPGLSLIVFSGQYKRAHYALVLASAAAAIGRPVSLFFTGEALTAVRAPTAPTAPGWHALAGTGEQSAAVLDARLASLGVATFEELLTACGEMGVRFLVCEMALRAAGLTIADLRADLALECAGVVTLFVEAGSDRTLMFV